ncbi:60S ribosomal protein L31 [Tanacetum coccineum]
MVEKTKGGARKEVVTREYTINLHKRLDVIQVLLEAMCPVKMISGNVCPLKKNPKVRAFQVTPFKLYSPGHEIKVKMFQSFSTIPSYKRTCGDPLLILTAATHVRLASERFSPHTLPLTKVNIPRAECISDQPS